MATVAENLDTAIANVAIVLASITASPKPTYTVGDKNVSWTEYLTALTNQLHVLRVARQEADGAFVVTSRGRT